MHPVNTVSLMVDCACILAAASIGYWLAKPSMEGFMPGFAFIAIGLASFMLIVNAFLRLKDS
jgi:hypothetical protein